MNEAYKYYIKIIKPIEKKYTKMCILYSIFKLNYFKKKKSFYNAILVNYYRMLQNNTKELEEIIQNLK